MNRTLTKDEIINAPLGLLFGQVGRVGMAVWRQRYREIEASHQAAGQLSDGDLLLAAHGLLAVADGKPELAGDAAELRLTLSRYNP